ncbi:c-type cytochrome [Caballeronia sp. KNU42]
MTISLSRLALVQAMLLLVTCFPAMAAVLQIDTGKPATLTTEALLAMPDAATIHVPDDVTYHQAMTYRAVPLRSLPGVRTLPADAELQITATDGFVTNLPAALVRGDSDHGATPWLAIEPRDKPWPRTSKGTDIGPFYLVWINPGASGVMSEQWPYQINAIRVVASRVAKWPQLAVDDSVPANSPIRRGQALFATQCMVCHRMNGAGDASVGPDLNLPRNPTEYFQAWALRAYIRDPKSIREWADMKMPGFGQANLSDPDLDAIIAYLGYMAHRRK